MLHPTRSSTNNLTSATEARQSNSIKFQGTQSIHVISSNCPHFSKTIRSISCLYLEYNACFKLARNCASCPVPASVHHFGRLSHPREEKRCGSGEEIVYRCSATCHMLAFSLFLSRSWDQLHRSSRSARIVFIHPISTSFHRTPEVSSSKLETPRRKGVRSVSPSLALPPTRDADSRWNARSFHSCSRPTAGTQSHTARIEHSRQDLDRVQSSNLHRVRYSLGNVVWLELQKARRYRVTGGRT